jgi:Phage tail-collar fibre protein
MAKITTAGLALIAQLQAAEDTLIIDKMIYANIDGLDPETEPPATEVKPDAGDIVRESVLAAGAYLDPNTVAFSDLLDATIGNFDFNWIGLYCTEFDTLIAVTYVPLQSKRATDGQDIGNTLCKNFAINYTDIKDLTGIVIEAAAWQQDFSGLYAVVDHDHDEDYEPIGAVAFHVATANPHPQYVNDAVAWGVVSSAGAKLSGSANWTVARNSTGQYQLNITDAGNYLVIAGFSEFHGGGADVIYVSHNQTTGIFNNNTANNVVMQYYHDVSYRDHGWNFVAIKL